MGKAVLLENDWDIPAATEKKCKIHREEMQDPQLGSTLGAKHQALSSLFLAMLQPSDYR